MTSGCRLVSIGLKMANLTENRLKEERTKKEYACFITTGVYLYLYMFYYFRCVFILVYVSSLQVINIQSLWKLLSTKLANDSR